jgi:DNA-binding response OmpR family regulator
MTAGRKILVIDDDALLLETASQLLRQRGFQVATHQDSFNRLNAVRTCRPDLILMDVNMPLVPGDEIVKLLQEDPDLRGIPVLLFSSNDERALRLAARDCGAAGYICKSQMGGQFAAIVERRLRALQG